MPKKAKQMVGLLFILVGISIPAVSAFVYQQQSLGIAQTIRNTQLWVNNFDATRDQWVKNGSSPYLEAQDEPNNCVYGEKAGIGSRNGDQIGDFEFEDTNQTGTIISVKLRVYGHASTTKPNQCYFSVCLWDGTSWTKVMEVKGGNVYAWIEADVSSHLTTWGQINGAKIYLITEAKGGGSGEGGQACDSALLVIDY